MDSLPAEILLEIGEIDKQTYRGMLAIPKFARAVTCGYRLDVMVKCKYEYLNLLTNMKCHNNPHSHKQSLTIRCAGSQQLRWGSNTNNTIDMDFFFFFHVNKIGYRSCINGTSYKNNSSFYGNTGFIQYRTADNRRVQILVSGHYQIFNKY